MQILLRSKLFLCLFFIFVNVGCDHGNYNNLTRIAIRIPSEKELASLKNNNKVQALSTLDTDLLCYYANVTAPDIPVINETCLPPRGVFSGGVGPGMNIELDVANGNQRIVQLFGYKRNAASDACPSFDNVPKPTSDLIYNLGQSDPFTVQPPETQVVLKIQFPNVADNLRSLNGWNSCPLSQPPLAKPLLGRTAYGSSLLTGSQFKISGRVSEKNDMRNLSGAQFKIHSWSAK